MNRSSGCSQDVLRLAGPIIIAMAILSPSARGQCVANELTTLTAADAAKFDGAGKSVSVSGDVAVMGADKDDAAFNSGAAYIFRAIAGKWEQEAKLTASDAAQQDFFGRSVAISGDAVLIGAYADDDAGESSGSAYVFRFDGRVWNQEAKLTASDASSGDRFGLAVALSNNVAVVGAAFDKDGGFYSGSVYVYRFDGATWV
ncbi:MAG: FG-GAP repeat protein, partial [Phycisphaerales bacterium]